MRTQLWPDEPEEHRAMIDAYFSGQVKFVDQVFVCEIPPTEASSSEVIGIIELKVRNYAEGSECDRVPYLEGWFVDVGHRKQGVGERLVRQAEKRASEQGFSELASDAEIDNQGSIAAHLSLGFIEAERSVSFLKQI